MTISERDFLLLASKPRSRGFVDLEGIRFDRLSVVAYLYRRDSHQYWFCQCDCGAVRSVTSNKLRTGWTKSCGCFHRDAARVRMTTHGQRRTPEYYSYHSMLGRCLCPTNAAYKDYGGRGITVCQRWIDGDGDRTGIECFFADMGRRTTKHHTLDREDNDGPYSPENCRWATRARQAGNRRSTRYTTVDGVRMSILDACKRLGVKPEMVRWRLAHGWSFERAVTQKKRRW